MASQRNDEPKTCRAENLSLHESGSSSASVFSALGALLFIVWEWKWIFIVCFLAESWEMRWGLIMWRTTFLTNLNHCKHQRLQPDRKLIRISWINKRFVINCLLSGDVSANVTSKSCTKKTYVSSWGFGFELSFPIISDTALKLEPAATN